MENIQWSIVPFAQLTLLQLYAVLQLRMEVFCVEQNCPYQDVDGVDPDSYHLMAWEGGKLIAYARLIPPGRVYAETSIGRVVTSPAARGRGVAHSLMQKAILFNQESWSGYPIQIGAQQYLIAFYQGHGFVQVGEGYLEDNIPHIHMVRGIVI
jgi:ElaA protein